MLKKFDDLDPAKLYNVVANSFEQVENAWQCQVDHISIKANEITNILYTGLGGSAISGDLLKNALRDELNVFYAVNRNYELPKYVNEKTLLIVSSYSGNTEETIAALQQGIAKKCSIICVTTGGKIEEIAKENNIPVVYMQKGFQPRYALYTSFFTILKVLQQVSLISDKKILVEKSIHLLKIRGEAFLKENNRASIIAGQLKNKLPIIYSTSDFTDSIGLRLKGQLNENSKSHAFHNSFPEMNHNEIVGWETVKDGDVSYAIISIIDVSYNERVKKRYAILNEIFNKTDLPIITVESNESDFLLRLLDMMYLSDCISYYLAIANEKDPAEIDYIHFLKEELSKI